jgi:hypothetical protein
VVPGTLWKTMTQTFNRRWKEIGEDRKPLREDQKEEDHLTKREDCRKQEKINDLRVK